MIEELFKAHQHTIAAIAAAGTFLAVLTSLGLAYSARRADRTKLKATAGLWYLVDSPIDPKTAPRLLKVVITNYGRFPLRIRSNFFYWKVPFRTEIMQQAPVDRISTGPWQWREYPVEIAPRTTETFTITTLENLEQEAKRMRGANTFADRLRFRFIRAFVRTDNGETFRVKLSSDVRKVWSVGAR